MVTNSSVERQNEADQEFIREALIEAGKAARIGEVPIGAIVVFEDKIIARAYNLKETTCDPTAHAEMLALRMAAQFKKGWRLSGATLYSTLEPCPMCAEAILQARVSRVVFGAYDQVSGALGSAFNLYIKRIYPIPEVVGGIMEQECAEVLREIFAKRRERNA